MPGYTEKYKALLHGNTALMYSCTVGNDTATEIILKSFRRLGLNVDNVNKEGYTALMLAAINLNWECASLLAIEGRADLTLCDPIGRTAQQIAIEAGASRAQVLPFSITSRKLNRCKVARYRALVRDDDGDDDDEDDDGEVAAAAAASGGSGINGEEYGDEVDENSFDTRSERKSPRVTINDMDAKFGKYRQIIKDDNCSGSVSNNLNDNKNFDDNNNDDDDDDNNSNDDNNNSNHESSVLDIRERAVNQNRRIKSSDFGENLTKSARNSPHAVSPSPGKTMASKFFNTFISGAICSSGFGKLKFKKAKSNILGSKERNAMHASSEFKKSAKTESIIKTDSDLDSLRISKVERLRLNREFDGDRLSFNERRLNSMDESIFWIRK
ncbi:hypothetical protein HELRODRAFT_169617 [Helobdella robusta]|uniref:Uncharacterized protein n=1 Tax=Helobdella robusta TaxID=6412 RepID=T1F262_HELRO|nr:hypothetical protein HELRODRAFT_169617 [Helobdella robusta]ESO07913.1 hypothetical protein HELRODRAFT_169617 [Helobdella robusta]